MKWDLCSSGMLHCTEWQIDRCEIWMVTFYKIINKYCDSCWNLSDLVLQSPQNTPWKCQGFLYFTLWSWMYVTVSSGNRRSFCLCLVCKVVTYLMMEASVPSKTLVPVQVLHLEQTTWYHQPEDHNLNADHHDSLNSHIFNTYFNEH